MTEAEARDLVEEIKSLVHDDEIAHRKEDKARALFIASIADGSCIEPAKVARILLETDDLDFCKWCA